MPKLAHAVFWLLIASGCAPSIGATQELAAHDIKGLRLGMTYQEARAWAGVPMEDLGRGQFKFPKDGQLFDIGFTPLAHLYRIDVDQPLGQFSPDAAFGQQLTMKLTAKFGPPQQNQLPMGPASWDFSEPIRNVYGVETRRPTESLSAIVENQYPLGMVVHLKLMDFRVGYADAAAINAKPSADAAAAVHF